MTTNSSNKTTFPTIYKRTETGAIQQWIIIAEGNAFYTIEGQVDGKLTTSKPTVCEAKNTGRSNETTPETQAYSEAERKWNKQLERGYTQDIEQIDSIQTLYKPMLAHKYKDYKDEVKYPIFAQVKLDGARCIMTRLGAFTRNGKEWAAIPHIREILIPFFKKYPNAILDGELYTHKLRNDFNKMMSLIKKTKPSIDDLFESEEMVEYWVYDCPRIGTLTEKTPFYDRYTSMVKELTGTKYIHIVETYTAKDENEMFEYYNKFLEEGYEGLMIRINKPYQNKRTKYLLKVKPHESDEFTIIGIRPGKGNKAGMAGHMDFHAKNGKSFTSNIKGTHEFLKELLLKRDELIGQVATVEYQNLTPDGLPRFPYCTSIRDYEN